MELQNLRNKIEKIDDELARLISERLNVCENIAAYKAENNLPVLDAAREKEEMNRILKTLEKPDDRELVQRLFNEVFAISKMRQEDYINR